MAVKTSGPISVQDLVDEFGGSVPHSFNEYYRGGGLVPATPNSGRNNNVPTTGEIQLTDFYSSSKTVVVTYDIIGAGGAGGRGFADGNGSGRSPSGGSSSISTFGVTAAGGLGGTNGQTGSTNGQAGQASVYGAGGPGRSKTTDNNGNFPGYDAPAGSYGAGGGGGPGDAGNTYDSSGEGGGGGLAGTRLTGTRTVDYGSTVSFVVGIGGVSLPSTGRPGGTGANGLVKISYDGINRTFTSSGSTVIN